MKLIEYIHAPFPRPAPSRRNILWVVLIGLAGSLFIILYNPFGIRNDTRMWYIDLVILGLGLLFIVSVLLMEWLLPLIFPKLFRRWTLGKALVWYSLIILVIGVNNFLYKSYWGEFGEFTWREFFLVLLRTLGIGITVTFFLLGIWQYFNRRRLVAMTSIESYSVTTANGDRYELNLRDILYIRSDDNYVDLHYQSPNGREKIVLRSSLKNIESQIVHALTPIFRCHRQFLINIEHFDILEQSSRHMLLRLQHHQDKVPVSKQYVRTIGKKMSVRP